MTDFMELVNMDEIGDSFRKSIEGSIQIYIDNLLTRHPAYRANWDLKDAGVKTLTEANIHRIVEQWDGGSWDNGENIIQILARQVKGAYVDEVINDRKTEDRFRDLESRAIRMKEEHHEAY